MLDVVELFVQEMVFQPQPLLGAGSLATQQQQQQEQPPAVAAFSAATGMGQPPQGTPSNLSLDHLLMLANLTNNATDWAAHPPSSAGTPAQTRP